MKRRRMIKLWMTVLIVGYSIWSAGEADAQLRIKVRPYLGGGYGRIMTDYAPNFTVLDTLDEAYYALNLTTVPKNVLRGQLRVDLLEWGPLSAGYLFWGHQTKYNDTAPQNTLKTGRVYPYGITYSLHGAALSLKLPFLGSASGNLMPFLMGGGGRYYGRNKGYKYVWADEAHTVNERRFVTENEWEDWGFIGGAGLIIYQYAYIYAGIVELNGEDLLGSRFFDVVIGFTF